MSLSNLPRDVLVGTALLGATFVAGVYVGKRYFLFRRKKSQKIFEGKNDPRRGYLLRLSLRQHPAAKKLEQRLSGATSQDVSSDVAQLLGNLTKAIGSRKVLEMGRSYGYNPLILALVLPADGKVTACVCDTEDITCARASWREAGVEDKIDVRIKPAEETLDDLISAEETGTFDLVSLNMADRQNCKKCYEKCLRLLRSGGILAIDGVLGRGAVLTAKSTDTMSQELHLLNEAILRDARVSLSTLPLGDGMTLCFKI
ncbi:catechol O-methyltransferase domain-containing protein 1 isoform X2 [Ascaphus truei]|uniref:catechol O-methyltransferase domain-containing protein 1 isoform X2 n=1 Tax=Ascaphus truei TaxID=8439 RepID=UPI003F5AD70A